MSAWTFQRGGFGEPSTYITSPEDGSAYYLAGTPPDIGLMQVPLREDGTPVFENEGDGFYGGGEVDWEHGFEDDSARERVRGIEKALRAA